MCRVLQTYCGDWLWQVNILDILDLLWRLSLQWPSVQCFRAVGSWLETRLSWPGCCLSAHYFWNQFLMRSQNFFVKKKTLPVENWMSGTDDILSLCFSYDNNNNNKKLDVSNTKDSWRKFMFSSLKVKCSVWQATVVNSLLPSGSASKDWPF